MNRHFTTEQSTVDFGFAQVSKADKNKRVRAVFDSVTKRYDLMNDLMSLGWHRVWKRYLIDHAAIAPGSRVLDLAAGTGDVSVLLAQKAGNAAGHEGCVIACDINSRMLFHGRDRLLNRGLTKPIHYVLADAENLPFPEHAFDCVTMAFGLRNVTDKTRALENIYRVLRIGAQCLILEFSSLQLPKLRQVYDWYSFHVLPRLGQALLNDASSYRYLAESIRRHPNQESLMKIMKEVGFVRCSYHNLSGGIVAVHIGYRE